MLKTRECENKKALSRWLRANKVSVFPPEFETNGRFALKPCNGGGPADHFLSALQGAFCLRHRRAFTNRPLSKTRCRVLFPVKVLLSGISDNSTWKDAVRQVGLMEKVCGNICGKCGTLEKMFDSPLTKSNECCILQLEQLFEIERTERSNVPYIGHRFR